MKEGIVKEDEAIKFAENGFSTTDRITYVNEAVEGRPRPTTPQIQHSPKKKRLDDGLTD